MVCAEIDFVLKYEFDVEEHTRGSVHRPVVFSRHLVVVALWCACAFLATGMADSAP